jgi:ABC-type molybdate transport system substrate-binding protein
MNPKAAIIGAFIVVAVIIVFFATGGKKEDPNNGKANPLVGSNTPAAAQVEISVLYSSEKKEWMQAAMAEFSKQNPGIKVTLKEQGSLKIKEGILDDKEKPTIVSPADSVVLNLLAYDWEVKNRSELFAKSGEDAPQSLLLTPLVFAIWESRAKVLDAQGNGFISWDEIHKAVSDPKGWVGAGGKGEWGFVKLGHTDPRTSNSGLQTILLMTFDFYKKTSGLTTEEVLNPEYQTWIKAIEKGVSKFETSTNQFMTDMIRFGPSKYDIAVVYENLAIANLESAQGRWEPLKVYYPQTTLWSDHPIAIVQADWVTAAQKTAARTFIEFLKSKPMQEKSLSYGFRPGDVSVPLKDADPKNPFNRLASLGIRVDIPPVATVPDGIVIENLLTMWSRNIGMR